MADGKVKIFRSGKHDNLTLWNGNKKVSFTRNVISTDDKSTIDFLKKKMKTDPHFCISEVKDNKPVEVVEVEVMQQAAIERDELKSKVMDAEIKAENAQAEIDELKEKLAKATKADVKEAPKKPDLAKK